MSIGRLTELQVRALRALSRITPGWTLTGGAALVGFYTAHRTTRDLDLFWTDRDTLGALPAQVVATLRRESLTVDDLQTAPTFHRLRVTDGREVLVVDLVAQRGGTVDPPTERDVEGSAIRVDTAHQILVNKLAALLGRVELRDLEDVRALVLAGGALDRALGEAPQVDAGFSPLTLAWLLETFPLRALGERASRSDAELAELDAFRRELITRLASLAADDVAR